MIQTLSSGTHCLTEAGQYGRDVRKFGGQTCSGLIKKSFPGGRPLVWGRGCRGVGEGAVKGLKVEFPTVARHGHQISLL